MAETIAGGWSNIDGVATYIGSDSAALVALTGLSVTDVAGLSSGISLTSDNDVIHIKLNSSVLGQSAVQTTFDYVKYSDLKLEFDDNVAQSFKINTRSLSVVTDSTSAATIRGNVNGYYKIDHTEGTISYIGGDSNKDFAQITGLSASGLSGISMDKTSGAIKIKEIALGDNDVNLSLLTNFGFDTNDYNFDLQLVNGSNSSVTSLGFGSSSANYWGISGTTAYLKHDTMEGWTDSGKDKITYAQKATATLATLSGLSGVTGSLSATDGVTVEGTKITITKTDLIDKNTPLSISGEGYSLFLSVGDDSDGTVGGDSVAPAWSFSGASATYRFLTKESWSLGSDSKTITYGASYYTSQAIIRGLSSTATVAGGFSSTLNGGSSIVITLGMSALTQQNVTLTDLDDNTYYNKNYSFSLAGDVATISTIGASSTKLFGASGIFGIQGDLTAYYSLSGTSVSYAKERKEQTLVTINGLSTAATSAAGSSNIFFNAGTSTITLNKGALGTTDVTLSYSYSSISNLDTVNVGTYSFALSGVETSEKQTDNAADSAATFSFGTGGTASLNSKYLAYYTLGGSSVIYHAPKDRVLATITGLNTNASSDNVKVANASGSGVITLGMSALTNKTVVLNNSASYGYKLALEGSSTVNGKTTLGFKKTNDWSLTNGTASYDLNTAEGWTLLQGETLARYASAESKNLFTISGLSGVAQLDETSNIIGYKANAGDSAITQGISLSGTKVTISREVLGALSGEVTLSSNDYTFELATLSTNDTSTKIGFGQSSADNYWQSSASGIFFVNTIEEGWELTNGKITYTEAEHHNALTITGLSATVTSGASSIGGISVSGNKVTISKEILSGASTTVTVADTYTGDGINYTFELAGASNGTLGFGQSSASDYWKLDDGKLSYVHTVEEGWVLKNGEITYTAAVPKELLSISGLTNLNVTGTPHTIAGVSFAGDSILLDMAVLGSGAISLVNGAGVSTAYTLNFSGGGSTAGFDNKDSSTNDYFALVSEGGTSVAYLRDIGQGWSLESGSSITYAAATKETLALITGLSTELDDNEAYNIKASAASGSSIVDIKLTDLMLPTPTEGSVVTVTDKKLDDGITYRFVLDGVTNTLESAGTSIGLNLGSGTATVKETRGEGWVFGSDSHLSLSYYGKVNNDLAVVSGLSSALTTTNVSFSATDHTITLGQSALTANGVSLSSDTYTLVLDGGASTFGFSAGANAWTYAGTSATYYSQTNPGWSLAGDSKSITYTSLQTADIFTITGLKSGGASSSNIGLSGTVITLGASALGTDAISLVKAGGISKSYTLGFTSAGNSFAYNVNAPVWTDVDTSGTATYSFTRDAYWTLSSDSTAIGYNDADTKDLVTIKGFVAGISAAALSALTTDGNHTGTITLGESDMSLLSDSIGVISLGLSNGADYKFSFGGASTIGFAESAANDYWTRNTSIVEFKHDIGKGWSLAGDSLSATFTGEKTDTLATISNLATVSLVGGSAPNSIAGIVVAGTSITIAESILPVVSGSVVKFSGEGYTFNLANDVNSVDSVADGRSGFYNERNNAYWTLKGGTAIYQYDITEGWVLAGDSITYFPAQTISLASITGLAGGLSIGALSGIQVGTGDDSLKITLDNRVLGGKEVVLTSTNFREDNFSLALATAGGFSVANSAVSANVWSLEGGNAVYKTVELEYYSMVGSTKIKYNAEEAKDTLASLGGLATGLKVSGDRKSLVTSTEPPTTVVSLSSGGTSFILSKDALNKKTVTNSTASSVYDLAFGDDVIESDDSGLVWAINNTNATVTTTVSEGYSISDDKKTVEYKQAKDKETVFTISGLKSGLTTDNINRVVDAADGKVTLHKGALGTSDIKLTNGTGYKYSLELDKTTTAGESIVSSKPDDQVVWRLSGTTATYKTVTPAYYTEETDGSIKYHAEADVGNPAVVITGLAGGLSVVNDSISGLAVNTNDKTVSISKSVLGTTDAKITSGGYSFAFDKTGGVSFAPTYTYSWETDSKTTSAIRKANVTEGYTLADSSKTIKYSAAKNGETIFKVTGLKAGLKIDKSTGKIYITDEDDRKKSIEITNAELGDSGAATTKGIITLPDAALSTTNISLTDTTNYELANDDERYIEILAKDASAPENKYKWTVSGTTAKYSEYTPAYYTFNADETAIEYHAEKSVKDLATVANLPKGIKVDENDDSQLLDSDDNIVARIPTEDKEVILTEDALNQTNITLTGEGYTLSFEDSEFIESIKPKKNSVVWSISGTTATLKEGTSGGYELTADGKTLKYTATSSGNTVATVKGLASGLKVNVSGQLYKTNENEPVITVDPDTNTIKLTDDAFGTANVVLTNSTGQSYTLAYGDGTKTTVGGGTGEKVWTVSNNNAVLREATTAKFVLDKEGTQFTRTAAKLGTTLTTIKGLKKGFVANAFGEIDGLVANGTTVTVSASLLDPKNTVTSSNSYTLALGSDVTKKPENSDLTGVWAVNGTSVTYGPGTSAGYVLENSDKKIVYKGVQGATTPTFTITNLKSGLKSVDGGKIAGIVLDDNTNIVTLSKSVLGTNTTKAMEIKSTDGYKLALDDDVNLRSEKSTKWTVSGTTAKYMTGVRTKGYYLNSDTEIKYLSSASAGTAAITLTGLKKGLKVGTNGKIEGIDDTTTSNKITLDSRVLGTSKVKLTIPTGSNANYTLDVATTGEFAVNKTSSTPTAKTNQWNISGTTATYRPTIAKGYTVLSDNKEITYTPASYGTIITTVKGLNNNLKVSTSTDKNASNNLVGVGKLGTYNADGVFTEAVTINETNKTVTIASDSALNKQTVSVDNDYKLNLANTVTSPTSSNPAVVYNKGTAKITVNTSEGYKLENGKVVYTPAKSVTTTITGLKSGVSESDLAINTTDNTITVKASALNKSKVTLSGGDFKLKLASDVNYGKNVTYKWNDGGATAVYQEVLPADSYYCDGNSITYNTSATTKNVATISGLPSSLAAGSASTAITINSDRDVFTLSDGVLQENAKNVIKITGNASLSLASNIDSAPSLVTAKWFFNGKTATYAGGSTAYYNLSTDGKSVTYVPFKTKETFATITGLPSSLSSLTADQLNNGISAASITGGKGNSVTISSDLLGTSTVKITSAKGYKFADTGIKLANGTASSSLGGAAFSDRLYYSGTKLTIEDGKEENWVVKNTKSSSTITYTPEKHGTTKKEIKATVTGLKSGLEFDSKADSLKGSLYGVAVNGKEIKLSAEALNKKTITLSGASYTLALDDTVPKGELYDPTNVFSKTTLTIKSDIDEGYFFGKSKQQITYTKAKTGSVIAKVAGLKNGVSEDDISIETKTFGSGSAAKDIEVITLSASALTKSKVSLTNSLGGYSLALADDVIQAAGSSLYNDATTDLWKVSSTTATLTETTPVWYKLASDKSVTYTNAKSTTLTKVTGLAKGLKAVDGAIDGIEVLAPTYSTSAAKTVLTDTGTVILDPSVLTTSTVKVTGNYIIQADYESPEMDNEALTVKNGRATLKGSLDAGYTLSADKKTLTYSKAAKSATLATIVGLSKNNTLTSDDINVDTIDKVINLSNSDIAADSKGNKTVTVSGKYEFNFDSDYGNGTIKGSTGSDTITIGGMSVTVNAGKGDDYITLNNNSSNGDTVIYASGDGNDVIRNFGSGDKLKITGVALSDSLVSVVDYDRDEAFNDILIKVGTGSILLADVSNDINFESSKGKTESNGKITFNSRDKSFTLK